MFVIDEFKYLDKDGKDDTSKRNSQQVCWASMIAGTIPAKKPVLDTDLKLSIDRLEEQVPIVSRHVFQSLLPEGASI